jgi:hypothetical protein
MTRPARWSDFSATRSPPTRSRSRPGDPLKASLAKLEVAEAAVEAVATGLKALA